MNLRSITSCSALGISLLWGAAADLTSDPDELNNLATEPEKNKDTILRMNALLNELMAKEVGKNDGAFLPAAVRPKQSVVFDKH